MYIYYDCVLVLIALTCLLLLIKDRYVFLLLPLLGIGMCIHHGFAIFVFPMLFAVMVYRYLVSEGKAKLRYAVLILLSLLIVGCSFMYFHFVASAKDKMSFEDACQYMAECTDKDIPDDIGAYSAEDLIEQTGYFYVNIDYVMYDGKVKNYGIQVVHPDGLIYSAILWIIMIPLICLFFKTFRRVTPKGFDKLVSILTPCSLFIILIAYLEADYGRWNGFMILTLISILISTYMISPKNAFLTDDTHTSEKKWTPGKLIVLLMILIPNMGAFAR